jgi:hypothetical protein
MLASRNPKRLQKSFPLVPDAFGRMCGKESRRACGGYRWFARIDNLKRHELKKEF